MSQLIPKCRGKRLYTNLRDSVAYFWDSVSDFRTDDAEIAKPNQPIIDWPFVEYYLESYFNLLRRGRKTYRYPVSCGSIRFAVSLW